MQAQKMALILESLRIILHLKMLHFLIFLFFRFLMKAIKAKIKLFIYHYQFIF